MFIKSVQRMQAFLDNAGPFWITVDIFCGNEDVFNDISSRLTKEKVQRLIDVPAEKIKLFSIRDLWVVKYSFPCPHIQGSPFDRDIHGAQIAVLFSEIDI